MPINMADQYVAFLRAINVGGRVAMMSALKSAFERLGLAEVATFIASGNIIFRSPAKDPGKLERQIERGLLAALGYPVTTFVRTTADVARLAACQPFETPPGHATAMTTRGEGVTLFIGFLAASPAKIPCDKVQALRTETDDFRIEGRELFWLRRGSLLDSPVSGALLEKTVGMPMTLRNANTVRRLAAKYPPPP